MNSESNGISRRDFLKSAAVGAAGVAAMGILGACGTTATGQTEAPVVTEGPVAETAAVTESTEGRVHGYCGPGDWLGSAPAIDPSAIVETIDTDVVVVGTGHAGLLATLGAVDAGVNVAVVETQPWSAYVNMDGTGINMGGWYGSEIANVNSKFFLDMGVGPYDTGEITYEFIKRSMGRCIPDVVKAYVQNSGAMFDRMVEIYRSSEARRKTEDSNVFTKSELTGLDGVYCDYSDMLSRPQFNYHRQWSDDTVYPIVSGDFKTWNCDAQFYGHQGNNIEYFNKYVKYYCEENGATYYFEHTGIELIQNDAGDVVGLIAEDVNNPGSYKQFNAAKGVVVTCGDFSGNNQMCWSLLNEYMEYGERAGKTMEDWAATKTRNGQGHKMMCWAGGMVEATPRGGMVIGGGASGPWGQHPFLQLNAKGKRWYNEAGMPTASPVAWKQTPGKAVWVTDTKLKESLYQGGLEHGAPNFGWKEQVEHMWETFDQLEVGNAEGGAVSGCVVAEAYAFMKGTIFAAETLDQLADFLGYEGTDKETFLAEVAHYNELCAAGKDTDFGKDAKFMLALDTPPYYGGVGNLGNTPTGSMVTLTGLLADDQMRVAKGGDLSTPIKGLYTAGNCLGGRYGAGYVTPISGNSIGMAMTHGWIAGKNAAEGV